MRAPLIVTVSELVDVFDPDFPEIRGHQATIYPIGSAKYMPVYLDLSDFTPDDRLNILLASTALPHGIFPAVQIGDAVYEDGGLSDNLPVYAAIKYADLAELSVIRLKPTGRRALIRTWQRVDRLIRLREMPFEEARKKAASDSTQGRISPTACRRE
jgi:predicted patatin/cPLA2 family phospholipase